MGRCVVSGCCVVWCALVWFGGGPIGEGLPLRALGPWGPCTCSSLGLVRLISSVKTEVLEFP